MSVGDLQISMNLEYNMLDYAKYYLENIPFHKTTDIFQTIKFDIISLGAFYELFFKYKLGLINASLIWKEPHKYNIDKHLSADFVSKDAFELVNYGRNFKWITESEYTLIKDVFALRNKFIHFSLCEQDGTSISMEIIKYDFFDKNTNLVKKLLQSLHENLKDNFWYQDIQKEHLL